MGHGDKTTLKAPSGAPNSLESSPQQVVINNAENIELHTTAVCVGTKGLEDLFCRETAKLQKKQHKGQKKIINKTFTARNKDATL